MFKQAKYWIWSAALLASISIGLYSCENPLDNSDLEVELNTDIIVPIGAILVVDANLEGEQPQNITITTMGQDAGKIYSLDGSNQLKALDGLINLAVRKENIPTDGNALKFAVEVHADGYLPTTKYFTIDTEEFAEEDIRLVNTANPPQGVTVAETTVNVGASGTTAPIQIGTDTGGDKQENVDISVKAGTKFLDADGNEVSGTAEVELVHFDNRSEESIAAFPGGFNVVSAVDENGDPMDVGYFETAGFFTMNVNVGGTAVKNFSEPLDVVMSLNEETINPETGEAIAEGTRIPLWSFEEGDDTWTKEGEAIVERNPETGKLQTRFQIIHLSSYNLDFFWGPNCRGGRAIKVSSQFEGNTYYYSEIVNAATNRPVSWYARKFLNIRNGNTLRFYNAPQVTAKIRVYRSWYNRELVGESPAFDLCGSGEVTLDLTSITPPTTVRFTGGVTGYCGSTKVKPTGVLYARKQGEWRGFYMGYMRNGVLRNYREFAVGTPYDMWVYTAGSWYYKSGVVIDSGTYDFGGGIELVIDVQPGSNVINIDFNDINIPDNYCDAIL